MDADGTRNREAVKKRRLFVRVQRASGEVIGFVIIEDDLLKLPWKLGRKDLRGEVICTDDLHGSATTALRHTIDRGRRMCGRG